MLQQAAENGFVLEIDDLGMKLWDQPVWATGPHHHGKQLFKKYFI